VERDRAWRNDPPRATHWCAEQRLDKCASLNEINKYSVRRASRKPMHDIGAPQSLGQMV